MELSYYREVQKYSEHFLKFIVNQLPVVGFLILKTFFASTQSELSKNTIGLEIWDHHGCRSASQSQKHRQKTSIFLESILGVFETPVRHPVQGHAVVEQSVQLNAGGRDNMSTQLAKTWLIS